jgi:hypothetical protein
MNHFLAILILCVEMATCFESMCSKLQVSSNIKNNLDDVVKNGVALE